MMKKLILGVLASLWLAASALASGEGTPLDKFPTERTNDLVALQRGAKLFVNYCLNCHSAEYMRYNRMHAIGLNDEQIKDNLLFAADKVGDTMKVAIDPVQAKEWFGAAPPDLSVIARSRGGEHGSGADYLYTYLRTFYRDPTRATGWNNLAFPNVAMPNVLWQLQGQQSAVFATGKDPHNPEEELHVFKGFQTITPGSLSAEQYNEAVADLVAYMQWMGEPAQATRVRLGVFVLLFLGLFTLIAWRLNAAYWKDVK